MKKKQDQRDDDGGERQLATLRFVLQTNADKQADERRGAVRRGAARGARSKTTPTLNDEDEAHVKRRQNACGSQSFFLLKQSLELFAGGQATKPGER